MNATNTRKEKKKNNPFTGFCLVCEMKKPTFVFMSIKEPDNIIQITTTN